MFAHGYGVRIVLQGFMFGILSLIAFRVGENMTGQLEGGRTMAFMVLALSQIVHTFNMRSEHSIFRIGVFTNPVLNKAALAAVLLMAVVLFTPLKGIFGLITLPVNAYMIGLVLIFVPVLVMETAKACGWIKRHPHP